MRVIPSGLKLNWFWRDCSATRWPKGGRNELSGPSAPWQANNFWNACFLDGVWVHEGSAASPGSLLLFCPVSEVQRNDIVDFYIINKNYPVLVNMISRQDEYFFRTLRIVVPNDLWWCFACGATHTTQRAYFSHGWSFLTERIRLWQRKKPTVAGLIRGFMLISCPRSLISPWLAFQRLSALLQQQQQKKKKKVCLPVCGRKNHLDLCQPPWGRGRDGWRRQKMRHGHGESEESEKEMEGKRKRSLLLWEENIDSCIILQQDMIQIIRWMENERRAENTENLF